MPLYTFQCYECGLQFEKNLSPQKEAITLKCLGCGSDAERVIEDVSFSFENESTHEGLSLQNTGVSSVDYDWDNIVGRSAEKMYRYVERRDRKKEEALYGTEHTKFDLLRSPDGDYDIMTPEELYCSWRVRDIHSKAMDWLQEKNSEE